MKILAITDMDSSGSGYKNICTPLFKGLAEMGHEIRCIGLMYRGEEHRLPFSIIPAQTFEDAFGMGSNLVYMWNPDIILVALDIPLQIQMYNQFKPLLQRIPEEIKAGLNKPRKYIAITPLENGPLTMTWAAQLMSLDCVFFISELGKQEALKSGLKNVEHLLVGVDTESWKVPTAEERTRLRDGLGIPQDAFVVLTVADNQERKNLWAGISAVSTLKKEIDRPVKYILVTRKQSAFGWKLDDLALEYDIVKEFMTFERGMPTKDLWGLYAASDVYLQPSKAEGLGLPVLDAMAAKVPVVATDTGAMHELLEDGRGFLVPSSYQIKDVWGNSKRDFIDIVHTFTNLKDVASTLYNHECIDRAYEYVKNRTWDIPVKQVDSKIRELLDEQTIQK